MAKGKITLEYLWKDRKRFLGMPLSFTRYALSEDRLFQSIANLETAEECRAYFQDLCIVKELQDMAQRLDTAILLSRGYSYKKIMENVAVSTATIGRVSKCLNYGTGGYRTAIQKLEESEESI